MMHPHRFQWLVLFYSTILYGVVLSAQTNPSTSLKIAIENAQTDTAKYRLINELALQTHIENPDSAYQLLEEILPTVKASNNIPLLIDLYYTKGLIYAKRQQFEKAVAIFKEAQQMAIAIDDQLQLAYLLDEIGSAYAHQNKRDIGVKYLKESLAVAKQIKHKRAELKAANNLGLRYNEMMETDSAKKYLQRAFDIEIERGAKGTLAAEILTNLGWTVGNLGQAEEAIAYYEKAIELLIPFDDKPKICRIYRNIGVEHYFRGDFPKTLEIFQIALSVVEGTTHYAELIETLDNMGDIYLSMEDYDNALLYLERAAATWERAHGNKNNSDLFFKRGRVHLLKEEYAKALATLLESWRLKQENGQFVQDNVHWNIGQAYEQLAQLDSASVHYQQATALTKNANNFLVQSQSFAGLGRIYEQQNNIEEAQKAYQSAYQAALNGNLKENEMDAAEGLYRTFKQQNKAAQALQYLEIARNIQDTLFNEKNVKEIAALEAGFEFEKEKQNLVFEQEKERVAQTNIRRLLYVGLVIAVLLLLIGWGYFRSKQKANAELSRLNVEILNQKAVVEQQKTVVEQQKAVVEQQKERLEEMDEVKSRFFTNISHEFRTPLTIISGMAEQIHAKPDQWLQKGSQMIQQNASHLLLLVNQILDLRKLESNTLKINIIQSDIIQYLQFIVSSYDSYAESNALQLDFYSEPVHLNMDYDPEKILRIVSNLLSNAVKYTPDGGRVAIKASTLKPPDAEQEQLQIIVKDTGVGISEQQLPYIFDRFYQVDDSSTRKGEGTGIGLALTRELVHLLKGQIKVESVLGKGSTFLVQLPISRNAELQPFHSTLMPQNVAPQKLNIEKAAIAAATLSTAQATLPTLLIVEDHPDLLQFLVACLEENFQLITAVNGQEGIDKATQLVPDIIISDVMMPEKNGFELCDTLKKDERTSHIPIILLTAKADLDSKISGLERGADAYLTKPFEQRELLVRLKKLLELRQKLQAHYRNLPATPPSLVTTSVAATPPKATPIEDAFIRKVRQTIEQEMEDENFNTAQLCKLVAMSRAQLHNKIKALTGLSTALYIRSVRLEKAKVLLETTDMNVSEVTYEVGFKSLSYFSRVYSKEFGVSPKEVRG